MVKSTYVVAQAFPKLMLLKTPSISESRSGFCMSDMSISGDQADSMFLLPLSFESQRLDSQRD